MSAFNDFTPDWVHELPDPCNEGVELASRFNTPAEAWAKIDRPDFLVWAAAELSTAPDAEISARLAYDVAKAVSHLYDDEDAKEVLARVERRLNGEALDVEELRTLAEHVWRARGRVSDLLSICKARVAHDDLGAPAHASQALRYNQEIEALTATYHAGYAMIEAEAGRNRHALNECHSAVIRAEDALSDASEAKRMFLAEDIETFDGTPLEDNLDAIKGLADLVRKHFTRPTVLDPQD